MDVVSETKYNINTALRSSLFENCEDLTYSHGNITSVELCYNSQKYTFDVFSGFLSKKQIQGLPFINEVKRATVAMELLINGQLCGTVSTAMDFRELFNLLSVQR